jgi:hypothetical protein
MKLLWLAVFAVPIAFCADRPVIVELFTSEGCSSCPVAELLLANMERRQPVPGVQIIALEEHVDYWNQLGWTDVYSSPQFRFRQNDYATLFGVGDVYTPQMVVGGQSGFTGSDRDTAIKEISKSLGAPMEDLSLETAANARNPGLVDLHVSVRGSGLTKGEALVYLAVTESFLATEVKGGENGGHTLKHAPVVRSFGVIGKLDPRDPHLTLSSTLKLPPEWKRENLRAVVFLQEKKSKRITGAAAIGLH